MVLQTLHKEYLGQHHEGHPGIGATKRRARETMYWPSLMLDIDSDIASCHAKMVACFKLPSLAKRPRPPSQFLKFTRREV